MLITAFSTASTQRIKLTNLSICYVSSYENDFSKFSKMQMFLSTQTYLIFYQFHFQSGFFKAFLGTRFGSLESEKIMIGSLKSEKIGSL